MTISAETLIVTAMIALTEDLKSSCSGNRFAAAGGLLIAHSADRLTAMSIHVRSTIGMLPPCYARECGVWSRECGINARIEVST